MDFHSMNRKALLPLCRKHKIPANGSNFDIANRLASLLKKPEIEKKSKTVKFKLEEENVDRNEKVYEVTGRSTRSRKAAEVELCSLSPVQKRKRKGEDEGDNKEGEEHITVEKPKTRRGKMADGVEKSQHVDVEIGVRVTRSSRNQEVVSNEVNAKINDISVGKTRKELKENHDNEEDVGKVAILKATTRETRSRKRGSAQGDEATNSQIAEEGSKHASVPEKTRTRMGKVADGVVKTALVDSDQRRDDVSNGDVEIGVRVTRSSRNRKIVSNEVNTSDIRPTKKQKGLKENVNNEEDVGKFATSKTTTRETRSRKRGISQADTTIISQIAEEGSKRASASEKTKTRSGKMADGVEKSAFIDSGQHGDVGDVEIGVRVTRSLRNREAVSNEVYTRNNDISPMKKQRGLKENENNEKDVGELANSKTTTRETRSRKRGNAQGDEAINSQTAEEGSKQASAPEKSKSRREKMANGVEKLDFVDSVKHEDVVSNGDVEIGVRVTRSLRNRGVVSNDVNSKNNDITPMKTPKGLKENQNNEEDVGKVDISKTITRETRSRKSGNSHGDKAIDSRIAEEGSKRASTPEKTNTRRGKMAVGEEKSTFVDSGQHVDVVSNGDVGIGVRVTRSVKNWDVVSNEVNSKYKDISPMKTQKRLKENQKNEEDVGKLSISKTTTRETRSRKGGNTQGDEAINSQTEEKGSIHASSPEQNASKRSTLNALRVDKKDESVSKEKVEKPGNEIQHVSKETRISKQPERTPRRSTRKVLTDASPSEEQVRDNPENAISQGTGRSRRNPATIKVSGLPNEQTMSKLEDLPRTSSSNSSKRKQEASTAAKGKHVRKSQPIVEESSKSPKRSSSSRNSIAVGSELSVSAEVNLPNRVVGEVEVQKKALDDDNRTDEKSAEDNNNGINHEMNLNLEDDLHISKTAEDKPENVCLTDSLLPLLHTSCQETKEEGNDRVQISADDKAEAGESIGMCTESPFGSEGGSFPKSSIRGHDSENLVLGIAEQVNSCESTLSAHNNEPTETEIGVHEFDKEASHQHDQIESSLDDGHLEPNCDSTNDTRDGSLDIAELSSCNILSKPAQGVELSVGSVDYPVEVPNKKIVLESVSRIQEEIVETMQPMPKLDCGSFDESPILKRQEVSIIENTAQFSLGNSDNDIQQQNVSVTRHVSENLEFVGNSSEESGEGYVKEVGFVKLRESPLLPRKSSTSDAHHQYGDSSGINNTPVYQGDEEPKSNLAGYELSASEISMSSVQNNGKEGVSVKNSSFAGISEEIDIRESIPGEFIENSIEYHAGDSILMAQTSHSFGVAEPNFADNSMDQKVFLDVEGSVSTLQQKVKEVNKGMEESEEVVNGIQGSVLCIKEPCEFGKENAGNATLYSSETLLEKDSGNPGDTESDDHVTEESSVMYQVSPLIVRKSSTREAYCHITPVSQESSETKPFKQVQNELVCLRMEGGITEDVPEDCIPNTTDLLVTETVTGDISEAEGEEEIISMSPSLQELPLTGVNHIEVPENQNGLDLMGDTPPSVRFDFRNAAEDTAELCKAVCSKPDELEVEKEDGVEHDSMLEFSSGYTNIETKENMEEVRDIKEACEVESENAGSALLCSPKSLLENHSSTQGDEGSTSCSVGVEFSSFEINTFSGHVIRDGDRVPFEKIASVEISENREACESRADDNVDTILSEKSSEKLEDHAADGIGMVQASHSSGLEPKVTDTGMEMSKHIDACESCADDNGVDTILFSAKSSEKLEGHAADGIGMAQASHCSVLEELKDTDPGADQKELVVTLQKNMEEVNEQKNQVVENCSEAHMENDTGSPDDTVFTGKSIDQEGMGDVEGNVATSQQDQEESLGQENNMLQNYEDENCGSVSEKWDRDLETAVASLHSSKVPQEIRSRNLGIEFTNWDISKFSGYNSENEETRRSEGLVEETTPMATQGDIESRCKTMDNEFRELDTKLFDGQSAADVLEARATNESNDCHVSVHEPCETENDNQYRDNIHEQEGEENPPEPTTVSPSYGSDSSLKNEVVNQGENESSEDVPSQDGSSKYESSELGTSLQDLGELGTSPQDLGEPGTSPQDLGELGQQEIHLVHINEFSRDGSPKIATGSPCYASTDIPLQNEVVCQGEDETVDNGLSVWDISLFSENDAGVGNASIETSEAVAADEIFELAENKNNLEERNVSTSPPQNLEEIGNQHTGLLRQGEEDNEYMHNIPDQREQSYGSDFPLESVGINQGLNDEFSSWDMSFFSENHAENNDSTFIEENRSCGEDFFETISPDDRFQASSTSPNQGFQSTTDMTGSAAPKND